MMMAAPMRTVVAVPRVEERTALKVLSMAEDARDQKLPMVRGDRSQLLKHPRGRRQEKVPVGGSERHGKGRRFLWMEVNLSA
eukprot:753807-Hanusia_phi.AAC.1